MHTQYFVATVILGVFDDMYCFSMNTCLKTSDICTWTIVVCPPKLTLMIHLILDNQ